MPSLFNEGSIYRLANECKDSMNVVYLVCKVLKSYLIGYHQTVLIFLLEFPQHLFKKV